MPLEGQKDLISLYCLCSDDNDFKEISIFFSANLFHLINIKKHDLIEKIQDQSVALAFLVVSKNWPKDFPESTSGHCFFWISKNESLNDENYNSTIDFGLPLKDFKNSPHWYIQHFLQIYQSKTNNSLKREWRDTIVEKLKTKYDLLEKMNDRLKKLSLTDDLTGIYNHRYFRQLYGDEMERAQRYNFSVSLLMIDVDHFKQVNDGHGHIVGDKVLTLIAKELQKSVRRVDTVCRYGGEEFVVILPMTTLKPAQELAERIRKRISTLCPRKSLPVMKLSVSIGVATFPEHGTTTESLLEAADQALYVAKTGGRNKVSLPTEHNPIL